MPDVPAGESLRDALFALWPSYLAYVVSFTTILIMWLHHHMLFKIIQRVDHRLLAINGMLLLLITFVNFPTAVLAQYVQTPQREIAALFYSGTFTVVAVVYNVLWRYASGNYRLLDRSADPAFVEYISRSYRLGPALYFVAFLAALLSAWLSLAINAGLAAYFAFTGVLRWSTPRE